MLKKTSNNQAALEQLVNLLINNPKNHVAEIIMIMSVHDIGIPKILAHETKSPGGPRIEILKSLCELTGYSISELLPHRKDLLSSFEKKYPDLYKGCESQTIMWSQKFKQLRSELQNQKEFSARVDFSTELNSVPMHM